MLRITTALKTNFSLRLRLFILVSVLIASSFACAERYFVDTQIFIRESQLHDTDINEINIENPLSNYDGFVFYPDGSFEGRVEVDNNVFAFSGNYGADDAGVDFVYNLTNISPSDILEKLNGFNNGLYNCQSNPEDDFFACIELRLENEVITFLNIQSQD